MEKITRFLRSNWLLLAMAFLFFILMVSLWGIKKMEMAGRDGDGTTTAGVAVGPSGVAMSEEELCALLLERSGFTGKFQKQGNNWVLAADKEQRVCVYPDLTWTVQYCDLQNKIPDLDLLPQEEDAEELANSYLKRFGIDPGSVISTGVVEISDQNQLRAIFETAKSQETAENQVSGQVEVIMGEEGELLQISDKRIWYY